MATATASTGGTRDVTRGAVTSAGRGATAGTARRLAVLLLLGLAAGAAAQDEIEVVASRAGFRPKLLNLEKGEAVRLVLTTADDEHCFAVDAFRVEKRIVPGRTTRLDLTPDRAGTFVFYCCLEPDAEAQRGRLVVSE